jgi:hypothetical protein
LTTEQMAETAETNFANALAALETIEIKEVH